MKKKALGAAIGIILILIGWQAYDKATRSSKESGQSDKPSVAVEVTPVRKTTIREIGTFTGTLLPKSQYVVAPKIAGRLEKLFVNIGDPVERGQVIALIDDDEFVQQVDQARAELDVARANTEENTSVLNLARREFERAQSLREKKIVSEAELDAAEAQYKAALARQKVASAQVAQKEAELKTAQVRLGYTRIQASWENGNGPRVVGERFADEGTMMTANTPIVSVIDISALKAVIHVIERDYPRMKPDQPAIIATDAFPDKAFTGKIARIAPLLKETARQARVEIDIPNPDTMLKPGMFVRVNIEFNRHENVTVVPVDSLVKDGDGWIVFLIDREQMRAQRVPVKLGIVDGDTAEITEPSISGLVVTVGQHLLDDGAAISLAGEPGRPSS
ncbi:MAG: efflux RND transporter periplasmic adaptor subunit [Syntrophaceae bacterium]|nr:efflux RND transporter periplasmic adaptor subunit [Syntrophaceae bacterium]